MGILGKSNMQPFSYDLLSENSRKEEPLSPNELKYSSTMHEIKKI
jgi:hypothetical protein